MPDLPSLKTEGWDTELKSLVRRIIATIVSESGRKKVMVDLPGNQALSVLEAKKHKAVTEDCVFRLVERDDKEIPKIESSLAKGNIHNYDLELSELVDLPSIFFEGAGFLNLDLMTQLTPRLMHLIDRVPYEDDAVLALTIHHPTTRAESHFLNRTYKRFKNRWKWSPKDLAKFSRNYNYITYTGGTPVLKTGGREVEKNVKYSFFLYTLLRYALRNHVYSLRTTILYSGSKVSQANRMITFIFIGITKINSPADNIMYLDTGRGHLAYADMLDNLDLFFS